MSLFLGLSETFIRKGRIVKCISFAPGGVILACVERAHDSENSTSALVVSIWVLKNGLFCAGSTQLPPCSDYELSLSSSITWHPSGNYLYVLDQGCVHLIKTKWTNAQYNRPMSLVELHSSILSDSDVKYESFRVLMSVTKSLTDLQASSLQVSHDGGLCLIGGMKEKLLHICPWHLNTPPCVFEITPTYMSLKANKPSLFSLLPVPMAASSSTPSNHSLDPSDPPAPPAPYIRICKGISRRYGVVVGLTATSSLVLLKVTGLGPAPRKDPLDVSSEQLPSTEERGHPLCSASPFFKLVFPTTDYGPPDAYVGGMSTEVWSRNKNTLWKVYDAVCFDSWGESTPNTAAIGHPTYIAVLAHRERITGDEQNMFVCRPGRIVAAVELVLLELTCNLSSSEVPCTSQDGVTAAYSEHGDTATDVSAASLDDLSRDRLDSTHSISSSNLDGHHAISAGDVPHSRNQTCSLRVVSRRTVMPNVEYTAVSPCSGRGVDLPTALRHSVLHVIQSEQASSACPCHILVTSDSKVSCFPFRVGAGLGRDPPDRNGPMFNPLEALWTIDIDMTKSIPPVLSTRPSCSPTSRPQGTNGSIVHSQEESPDTVHSCVFVAVGAGKVVISTSLWQTPTNALGVTSVPPEQVTLGKEERGSTIHAVTLLMDPVGSTLGRPVSCGALLDLTEGSLLLFGSRNGQERSFASVSALEGLEESVMDTDAHGNGTEMSGSNSHGAPGTFMPPVTGLPLYPTQGYAPYHTAKLPRSLLHDAVVNGCGWSPAPPSLPLWEGMPIKHAGSAVYAREGGLHMHQQGCGLVVARDGQGMYMACALAHTSLSRTSSDFHGTATGKREVQEGSVNVWLYSLRTSKWKILQPAVLPSASFVTLLPFRGNLCRSFSTSANLAGNTPAIFTRKQYCEAKPTPVDVKGMQWFNHHTLCLVTVRSRETSVDRKKPCRAKQCCVELMSRTSSSANPSVVRRCNHTIPGLNPDARRVCDPRAYQVIPLPDGFEPEFMDVVCTSVHLRQADDNITSASISTASSGSAADAHPVHSRRHSRTRAHPCASEDDVEHIRRSISRGRCGDDVGYFNARVRGSQDSDSGAECMLSSCILLLGAGSYFMALHITATQKDTSDKDVSHVERSVSSFLPTSYEVMLLWELDLRTDVKYESPSPTIALANVDNVVKFPIATALVLPMFDFKSSRPNPRSSSAVDSHATHRRTRSQSFDHSDDEDDMLSLEPALRNDDVGMALVDSSGKVIQIILSSRTVSHGWGGKGVVVTRGGCTAMVRLEHSLLPNDVDTPAPLRNVFLLLSAPPHVVDSAVSKGTRDLLWFPADNFLAGTAMGGSVVPAPIRHPAGTLISLPTDNECLFLANKISLRLRHHFSAAGSGGVETRPTLVLFGTFMPLALVIGLLNTHAYPWITGTRKSLGTSSCATLVNKLLVPIYTFNADTMKWMKYVLSYTSLHPLPLQHLVDGVEMTLKKMIDQPNFTRHSSKFAVPCAVLFACDDVLFMEVLSRLSRKLEPAVSAGLFPLPNCRLAYTNETNSSHNHSRERYTIHSENAIRSVRVGDSPWDQITIFELCLTRSSLPHASRFLTLACEQLGGAQSMESIAASLVLSCELLFECLRCMSLENALECLDFCVRLDVMASEVRTIFAIPGYLTVFMWGNSSNDVSSLCMQVIYRQQLQSAPSSSVYAVARTLSQRLVSTVSLLSPFLGSDLHILVEDTLCPQNERAYSGVDLYAEALYREPCTNVRLKKLPVGAEGRDGEDVVVDAVTGDAVIDDNAAHPSPASTELSTHSRQEVYGVSVGTSQHVYYAFLAANQYRSHDTSRKSATGSSPVTGPTAGSAKGSDHDVQVAVQHLLHQSYSGTIVRMMCKSLLEHSKFMCCATMMAAITSPLSIESSASDVKSWVEKALFSTYSSPSPIMLQQYERCRQSNHEVNDFSPPVFKQSSLYQLLRVMGFHTQDKLCTGSEPHGAENSLFAKIMARSYQEFELRRKCETEMYVHFSGSADEAGCLVNTHCFSGREAEQRSIGATKASRRRTVSLDESITSSGEHPSALQGNPSSLPGQPSLQHKGRSAALRVGYTAVPLHGRAASKFTIPSFSTGRRACVGALLRGLAAAAWMIGAIDIIVVSGTRHMTSYPSHCMHA